MLSVVKGALEGEWSDSGSDVILTAMENLIDGVSLCVCVCVCVCESERDRGGDRETDRLTDRY